MPVTDVQVDTEALRVTALADVAAPLERVWQVYADPRQLERVWGPPSCPASVVEHDLQPGGAVTYVMTGPDGTRTGGRWDVVEVIAPTRLEFTDRFADPETFEGDDEAPAASWAYTFAPHDHGTRVHAVGTYGSADDLQQVIGRGVVGSTRAAMAQIDELLAHD